MGDAPEAWATTNLPRLDIRRIYVTTAAQWKAGALGREAVVGYRIQIYRRKGLEAKAIEVMGDAIERQGSLARAQYRAAILALQKLNDMRPDLKEADAQPTGKPVKRPIELHTEYWEVDRVITGRSRKQLSDDHVQLQKDLREARRGLQVISVAWGAKRRAAKDRLPYHKQFGKLNSRLRRLAGSESKGEGPKFFVNLYAVGALRKEFPVLAKCTALEVLSYHVVRKQRRRGKELADAIGVPAKTVYNAVNRVDRMLSGGAAGKQEPASTPR